MYTYEEFCEFDDITPAEARKLIREHDQRFYDFLREVGRKEEYSGQEILDWLGY